MRAAAGKSSRTSSVLSLGLGESSHVAPRGGPKGEAETGMDDGTGWGEVSEGRLGEGSENKDVTGESSAGRMGLSEEDAISES